MRGLIIISGVSFTIGNVVWRFTDEPKLFYVPLSVFLTSLIWTVKAETPKALDLTHLFLRYLLILSLGNIVKQLFYDPQLAQINDYIFGGIVTVWLFAKLMIRWAINTRQTPGRS